MESAQRRVVRVVTPVRVLEGAGVRLMRSIALPQLDYLDPFLLFDHFGSDNPADYIAGFPMHPHRGIETVTYMLAGLVHHKDSLGNEGSIRAGDVQWMSAGGGILHEEMPKPVDGKMEGFQLWVNLPAKLKLTKPCYQEVASATIPEVPLKGGGTLRLIAGTFGTSQGPVKDIAAQPTYFDVSLPPGTSFLHTLPRGQAAFAYVFRGEGKFDDDSTVSSPKLAIFGDGERIRVTTEESEVRFVLASGKPLHEPIARYGPFVMNTAEEIDQALRDLRNGTFVWKG